MIAGLFFPHRVVSPAPVLRCVEQSAWSELCLCQAGRQPTLIIALFTELESVEKRNQM